jgi:FAD-dependent urate hydroxylase
MRRAVIIGAGPAGLVSALALRKAGWEAAVFEAYDRSAGLNQGVFLTLAVNGMDALRAVDAHETVMPLGFPTGQIRFLTGTGRDLGAMAIGPVLADGTVTRTLRRADLYAALHELAVQRGIAIHHGKRLTSADTSSSGTTAGFADGSSADADVLIGADGLRSAVRPVIDPNAPVPKYSGMGNVGALTRTDAIDVSSEAADGDYRMIWGKRCFFGYTVSPDGEIWWFANPPSREPLAADERDDSAGKAAARKQRLIDLLAVDAGPAATIVAGTEGPILFGNQETMPRVPVWQRDAMVIVGDAAHAVSPATGQGVSLACEDAVVLSRCLRDSPTVSTALTTYERLRRERVDRVSKWGAKIGGTKTVGPVGRVVRDLMLPHILAHGATPKAMAKQAWLFDHRIAWDTPTDRSGAMQFG